MLEKVDYGGKGMTSEQLAETIESIRKECKKHDDCYKCIFGKAVGIHCQIMELIETLADDSPCQWNMSKIERIINE